MSPTWTGVDAHSPHDTDGRSDQAVILREAAGLEIIRSQDTCRLEERDRNTRGDQGENRVGPNSSPKTAATTPADSTAADLGPP